MRSGLEFVEDFPSFDHNGDGRIDDNDLLFAVTLRSGKPEVALHGELAEWFAAQGLSAHVTVSDEQDYAVAFVVVERA